jgi:hypothetical protein
MQFLSKKIRNSNENTTILTYMAGYGKDWWKGVFE